jgi:hypothetical protein
VTFWDWLWKTQQALESKLTRFLGILVAYWSVAQDSAAFQGLIPAKYKPFVGVGMGALIFWRGQSTSDTYQLAKTIVADNPKPPLTPPGKPALAEKIDVSTKPIRTGGDPDGPRHNSGP